MVATLAEQQHRLEAHVLEKAVVGELSQAVHRLDEELLKDECVVIGHHAPGHLEAERHDLLGGVVGRRREHLKDVLPAGADVGGAVLDQLREAAHHQFADLAPCAVLLEDLLEGLQEGALKVKVGQLVLLQELARELSQRIDRVHGNVQVLVAAHLAEVLLQVVPDAVPHQANAAQVEVRILHDLLQREDARRVALDLAFAHRAQAAHELDDRVAVQPLGLGEEQVDHVRIHLLAEDACVLVLVVGALRLRLRLCRLRLGRQLRVAAGTGQHLGRRQRAVSSTAREAGHGWRRVTTVRPRGCTARRRRSRAARRRTAATLTVAQRDRGGAAAGHRLLRAAVRRALTSRDREGGLAHAVRDQLQPLQLAGAQQHLLPAVAQVVAVGVRQHEQRLGALDVLAADRHVHLELGELVQRVDERVALGLQEEDARHPDGRLEALQAELDCTRLIAALQHVAEGGQHAAPAHLEHGPHVLHVLALEVLVLVAHLLAQLGAARLQHALRLLMEEDLALARRQHVREVLRGVHSLRVVGDTQRCGQHARVDAAQEVGREVGAVVDAAPVADHLVLGDLDLDLGAVQIGGQHDDAKGEHVGSVGVRKVAARVVVVVLAGEALHDAVDHLRLLGQTEAREELAQRLVDGAGELELVHVGLQHASMPVLVLLVAQAQVLAHALLAEPTGADQEGGHRLGRVLDQLQLDHGGHAAPWVPLEELLGLLQLLVARQLLGELVGGTLGRGRPGLLASVVGPLPILVQKGLVAAGLLLTQLLAPLHQRVHHRGEAVECFDLHGHLLLGGGPVISLVDALRDTRQIVHHALVDVTRIVRVAVVVQEELHQDLGVVADVQQRVQHQPLLPDGRIRALQNAQEDALEEDAHLVLEVIAELVDQRAENQQREAEDARHTADSVRGQHRHAQVLAYRRVDEALVPLEAHAAILQNRQQQLQCEHLAAHVQRVHCGALLHLLGGELAERAKHRQTVQVGDTRIKAHRITHARLCGARRSADRLRHRQTAAARAPSRCRRRRLVRRRGRWTLRRNGGEGVGATLESLTVVGILGGLARVSSVGVRFRG
mmetsp:Transcript_3025/g.9444  ORF Transcript_3025/g.9444 Transcript_3025/m.9444 type:complete len:1065 (-) Transcript_3025:1106-4300(-)